MLAHVVNKVNTRLYSLDNAESINVHLVEHIDEATTRALISYLIYEALI